MASKKKSPKKSASKKPPVKSAATANKKAGKVSTKKAAKKVANKPAGKTKAASKKKATNKAVKKTSTKKAVTKKAVKKASSKKKVAKKAVKKTSSKKKAVKKISTKKTASKKKTVSATKPASKKKAVAKPVVKSVTTKKVSTKKKAVKKPKEKRVINKPTPPKRIRVSERKRNVQFSDAEDAIHGIAPYKSTAGEHYMNDDQLDHFEGILLAWKDKLMQEVDRTMHHMQDEASNFPDPTDRATQESEFGLELRTRDRERKLIKKIDSTLKRIEQGDYGYCEETGEEIGLRRLEARPVATLSVEAQERRELAERQFRDNDDRYR